MNIARAKNLRFGDKIKFPADRGNPAGVATVRTFNGCSSHQLCDEHKTVNGVVYIWVQHRTPNPGAMGKANSTAHTPLDMG
jgi:hypothetical protein